MEFRDNRRLRRLPGPRPSPARSSLLVAASRSAQAPLIVAAEIASAGDIFMCVQASDSTNGMLSVGDEPGL